MTRKRDRGRDGQTPPSSGEDEDGTERKAYSREKTRKAQKPRENRRDMVGDSRERHRDDRERKTDGRDGRRGDRQTSRSPSSYDVRRERKRDKREKHRDERETSRRSRTPELRETRRETDRRDRQTRNGERSRRSVSSDAESRERTADRRKQHKEDQEESRSQSPRKRGDRLTDSRGRQRGDRQRSRRSPSSDGDRRPRQTNSKDNRKYIRRESSSSSSDDSEKERIRDSREKQRRTRERSRRSVSPVNERMERKLDSRKNRNRRDDDERSRQSESPDVDRHIHKRRESSSPEGGREGRRNKGSSSRNKKLQERNMSEYDSRTSRNKDKARSNRERDPVDRESNRSGRSVRHRDKTPTSSEGEEGDSDTKPRGDSYSSDDSSPERSRKLKPIKNASKQLSKKGRERMPSDSPELRHPEKRYRSESDSESPERGHKRNRKSETPPERVERFESQSSSSSPERVQIFEPRSPSSSPERVQSKVRIVQRSPDVGSKERMSRSSRPEEVEVGGKHDLAKFESEPESGELTDSENEDTNRVPMKSYVKNPNAGKQRGSDKESEDSDDDRQRSFRREKEERRKRMEEEEELKERRKRREERHREQEEREKQEREKARDQDDRSARKRRQDDRVAPNQEPKESGENASDQPPAKKPKAVLDVITGRTGGAYIPPAKLRAMQASITDKTSEAYQRISWEALKKSINGLINKVNVSNIIDIVRELFQENIVRGRGLMARSIIQAQSASPTFTHVYAALVAIINTKFPQNGELILRRLIIQFRRGFKRNDKNICLSSTRFIAHLVNQQVAHEVLALEILTLLLETPTDDSVEVAIGFLKESGQKLTEVSPRGISAIFERIRNVLHEGQVDTRVQYMMEVMFAVRKDGFKDHPAVIEDLDLVEEEDQFTHLLTLEDGGNPEDLLNIFRVDPDFQENEEKYKLLKKEILDEGSSDEESGSEGGSDSDSEESDEEEEAKQTIIDNTETNLVSLRRTIYLTIQSSLDFEECAHKVLKMELKPGQEIELCNMILDCCAQTRTYEKFFGLLAQRFCMIDKKYVEPFQNMFKDQYDTIHRLETNKLRNVSKFFAHLLHTDAINWGVLSCIQLNEEDTTSASRIFIKILFQELSEYMGLPKLNDRLKDPTLQEYFIGVLPKDNPRNTRFAINFFTTIGLGGLTDDLRDHLKNVSKKLMQQKQEEAAEESDSDSSSSQSSSDSDSNSSDSSSSDSSSDSGVSDSDSSESSDSEAEKRKRKKKEKVQDSKKRGDVKKHDDSFDKGNSRHASRKEQDRYDRVRNGDITDRRRNREEIGDSDRNRSQRDRNSDSFRCNDRYEMEKRYQNSKKTNRHDTDDSDNSENHRGRDREQEFGGGDRNRSCRDRNSDSFRRYDRDRTERHKQSSKKRNRHYTDDSENERSSVGRKRHV